MVKVPKRTYQLGGVRGVRITVKMVRWDIESKGEGATWPSTTVTISISTMMIELEMECAQCV